MDNTPQNLLNSTIGADSQTNLLNILKLKISAINVNSIISHSSRYDFIKFANQHKPDILLLNESKLNSRHKLLFSDYIIHRTDRPNSINGGGTAALIHNSLNLPCTQIHHPSPINNIVLEYTISKIELNQSSNLFIISGYANNQSNKIFLNELDSIFSALKLHHLNNYFILAGDLNSRNTEWGDTHNNYKGNLLYERKCCCKCQIYSLPPVPTNF